MLGILESEKTMVKKPNRNARVQDIVDFYLHSKGFAALTGASQKAYERHLESVVATEVKGRALGQYRARTLRVEYTNLAYEEWLKTGIRTANYRKAALSVAWTYAMRMDIISNDPVRLIKARSTKPRKVKWTREQVKLFLDVAYSDYKWRSIGLIVHMAYDLAQRVGDMRMLEWQSVNLDAQRMDITQSKRGADVHLPLSDSLTDMLRQQKEDFGFQPYVAPKPKPVAGAYRPYTQADIDNAVNAVKREAGLPKKITAMDLRRTAITEMVEAGVDLAGVMQVSGHRSPVSVQPYMVNTFSGASKALAQRNNND